jgi:hypothetical protein
MLSQFFIALYRLRWFVIGITISLIYFITIVIYAENIPFADDLSVLASLYDIHHEPDWYLKYKTLFAFHNEHRIVIPRLITILIYHIQGKTINVAWWIILGNVLLFLVFYLYFKTEFTNHRIKLFIPVLLFVLQPMHYELMYWGMAALQNIGVIALATIAFYQLTFKNNKFLPVFVAILAVFTSANGVFVFLIGIPLLFYKREWFLGILWVIVGVGSAYLYWKGFSASEHSGKGFEESFHIFKFLGVFVSLVGGILYTQTFSYLSLLLGLSILGAITFIGYYRFIVHPVRNDKSQQFLISCLAFTLLTIAAISFNRDLHSVLSVSRYKLYSTLVISLTYILLINWIGKSKYVFNTTLVAGLLFWAVSYSRYTVMFDIHSRLLFSHFFTWRYSGMLDIYPPFTEKYYSDHWYKFYQSGQYTPPQSVSEKSKEVLSMSEKSGFLKASFSIDDQLVTIKSVSLPVNEYYAVHKTLHKLAIYPLNRNSFYKNIFSTSQADYSTSINASYWISDPGSAAFIIQLN